MRFLIDAQLPPALAGWLRERGHEAEHVADVGMVAASDMDIGDYAESVGAVLVTKDEDPSTGSGQAFWLCGCRTASGCFGCGAAMLRIGCYLPGWSRAGEIKRLLTAGERVVEVR